MRNLFAVQTSAERRTVAEKAPPLENGDRLDQATFHSRYQAMAEHVRAELIGGIVYMASPQKLPHGRCHKLVMRWLEEYEDATPGTESLFGVTNILGLESEPEPDGCLVLKHGGKTYETIDQYLAGPPEFLVEIASSTESIDLHAKKDDYERAGVGEYVVVALRKRIVLWFLRRRGGFKEVRPDTDGIHRSRIFPGLWLDPDALLDMNRGRLLSVLRQGIATTEHQAFVAKLGKAN